MKLFTLFIATCLSLVGAQDVECGRYHAEKRSCPDGECCSVYGHCGTSEEHCSSGCQRPFGYCGKNPPGSRYSSSKDSESVNEGNPIGPANMIPLSASSEPLTENFCLKIATPGHPYADYILTSRGPDVYPTFRPAATDLHPALLLKIRSSGRLTTADGFDVVLAHFSAPLSKINYFLPAEVVGDNHPAVERCSVDEDNLLQCQVSGRFNWNRFACYGNDDMPYMVQFKPGSKFGDELDLIDLKVDYDC